MAKKANGTIGLSLAAEQGVLVETSSEGEVISLESFPVSFAENKLQDPEVFAIEIARQLENKPATKVCLTVEPLIYAVRTLDLPVMPQNELKEVVEGEATQYLIFENQPVFTAFSQEQQKETHEGKMARVFLVATAKPPLQEIIEPIKAKKEMTYCTAPVVALLGFYLMQNSTENFSAVVFGENQSYFFGVQEGKVIFARSLDYGEAHLAKGEHEDLLLECQNTVTFFENREGVKVDRLVVIGTRNHGKLFAQQLDQRIVPPTTFFDPLEFISFANEELKEKFIAHEPYSIQAFTCQYLYRETTTYLNFIPYEEAAEKACKFFLKRTLIPVPLTFLLFFSAGFLLNKKKAALEEEARKLQAEIAQTRQKETKSQLEQEIAKLRQQIARAKAEKVAVATRYPRSGVSSLLRGMQAIVPSSCWMDKVEFKESMLTFQGHATTQIGAAQFVEQLSSANICQAIGLASFERKQVQKKNVYDFTVLCHLKGGNL